MYYAKSTNGFYDPEINKTIPADAVEVTPVVYKQLFDGQSAGKVIKADADGRPILVDLTPPPPPPPQKTLAELQAQLEALAAQIAAMQQST
jgi:hypothetical protein